MTENIHGEAEAERTVLRALRWALEISVVLLALEAVAVIPTLVPSLVTVTLASRITAPILSVTVTRSVPSSLCAIAGALQISARINATNR